MHPASTPEFWHSRWDSGQIGFHEGAPNRHLVARWPGLAAGRRVLVPLCGKSVDLAWLASQGHEVTGVDLSGVACAAFFAERGLVPEERVEGRLRVRRAGGVTLYEGDVFDLDGTWDAVWDRAALVALPPDVRVRYAAWLSARLRPDGRHLLVTFEYDQARRDGPPFAVHAGEVGELFPGLREVVRVHLDEPRWADVGGAAEVVWEG